MNNLGSLFKTIRIGEKLVANYKGREFLSTNEHYRVTIRIAEIWWWTVMAASVREGQPTKL